jgi:ArsR family transcriptional regulator
MPKLEAELVIVPKTIALQVEVEPALNVLNSLVLLSQVDRFSGLGEWINETAAKMDPSNWERHRIIVEGLYFSIIPQHSYDSFEAFIDDLANSDPVGLRDKVLNAYCMCHSSSEEYERYQRNNWEAVLHSEDDFIEFMHTLFEQDEIDENVERAAYNLLVDPPAMRDSIVSHLRFMWKEYMAAEWERVLPTVKESVAAFQKADISSMSLLQAAHFVTGREPDEKFEESLLEAEKVIFVPNTHNGPYALKYYGDGIVWMTFGARVPEGMQSASPDLKRSDLLVRLTALADETRLRILAIIREQGEMCSQELIDRMEISQSSISRHLRQLTATGYLVERRTEAGKCYQLNTERIGETLQALDGFFE